jgi:regulator of sigma D
MADEQVVLDMDLEVKVGKFSWKGKLSDVAKINMNKLGVELARQPELVSWFGVVYAEAIDAVSRLKNEVQNLQDSHTAKYAELDLRVRTEAESKGKDKPTEPRIKAMILTHPEYVDLQKRTQAKQDEQLNATSAMNKIGKLLVGLEHKKDMLIQLSANVRKELTAGNYEDPSGTKPS